MHACMHACIHAGIAWDSVSEAEVAKNAACQDAAHGSGQLAASADAPPSPHPLPPCLGAGAEVEAFVHGALCVSYSGQCFSSEAWGGRSANRGQCAQACRMPYGLMVDGQLSVGADWLPR